MGAIFSLHKAAKPNSDHEKNPELIVPTVTNLLFTSRRTVGEETVQVSTHVWVEEQSFAWYASIDDSGTSRAFNSLLLPQFRREFLDHMCFSILRFDLSQSVSLYPWSETFHGSLNQPGVNLRYVLWPRWRRCLHVLFEHGQPSLFWRTTYKGS